MYFVDTIVFVLCVSGSRKRFIYILLHYICIPSRWPRVNSDLFLIGLSTQAPLFHSISINNSCYAFSSKNHFKLHCLGKITGEISPRSGARELRYQSGRNRQNRYSCKGICWTHQSYCRIFTVAGNNQSCAFFRRGRPVKAFQVARDEEREWKHSAISSQ